MFSNETIRNILDNVNLLFRSLVSYLIKVHILFKQSNMVLDFNETIISYLTEKVFVMSYSCILIEGILSESSHFVEGERH